MTPNSHRDRSDDRSEVGDQNVERLLGNAYLPEEPQPEFVQRLQAALLAAAGDLARSRPAAPSRGVEPQTHGYWWLAGPLAVLAAGLAVILLPLTSARRPIDQPSTPVTATVPSPAVATTTSVETPLVITDALAPRTLPAAPAPERVNVGGAIATGPGQRRRLQLPDGSVMYVNQNTRVRFDADRRVNLLQGEVFVEVAPRRQENAAVPFLVKTNDREVTALGTKFRVFTEKTGTEVLVTQGKVKVSGQEGVVGAGQQLLAAGQASTLSTAPRATHVLDWIRDLMTAAEAALVPASRYTGGALVATDAAGQEALLSLRRYHIDVHIEDGFARTTIDQTYFNQVTQRLEGTFYFPLPPDASISRLAMYVDGQRMEGGMAERTHARQVFDSIVNRKKDPALLEWVDGSTFKMRVFPLEGRQEKRIILSYSQRLPVLYGRMTYRFPAGHNLGAVDHWSFVARVKGGANLTWNASGHELKPGQENGDLLLEANGKKVKLERDVVLEFREEASAQEVARFSSAVHEGARYLMLRYRPQLAGQPERQRRDWVFLFESSADRDPLLARVQVEVIRTLLNNAEPDDTFAILTAGTNAHPLSPKPELATPENIRVALATLERTHLIGALDLGKALSATEPFLQAGRNPYLVHVGSGLSVLGEQTEDVLARRIPEHVRYVGVAVGKRWARGFMRAAAERTGGLVTQINPDEEIRWRAFELFATLCTPRFLNVKVVDNAEQATFLSHDPAISQGEEIAAIARIDGLDKPLPTAVTITGQLDGKPFQRILPVTNVAERADYLPRTWAKLEIDRLLAADATANKDRIVALSMAMYVMTPYTSLLVLETEEMYKQFNVDRGRKDHWALYNCPDKIPVVHEPLAAQPVVPQPPAPTPKPTALEVYRTILTNPPATFLDWPSELRSYNRWDPVGGIAVNPQTTGLGGGGILGIAGGGPGFGSGGLGSGSPGLGGMNLAFSGLTGAGGGFGMNLGGINSGPGGSFPGGINGGFGGGILGGSGLGFGGMPSVSARGGRGGSMAFGGGFSATAMTAWAKPRIYERTAPFSGTTPFGSPTPDDDPGAVWTDRVLGQSLWSGMPGFGWGRHFQWLKEPSETSATGVGVGGRALGLGHFFWADEAIARELGYYPPALALVVQNGRRSGGATGVLANPTWFPTLDKRFGQIKDRFSAVRNWDATPRSWPASAEFLTNQEKTRRERTLSAQPHFQALQKKLERRITLDKGFEANTRLIDALDFLAARYGVTFYVNEQSFDEDLGIKEVQNTPVQLPAMHDVTLGTALRILLERLPGTYLLCPDFIEVTTTMKAERAMLAGIEARPVVPFPGGAMIWDNGILRAIELERDPLRYQQPIATNTYQSTRVEPFQNLLSFAPGMTSCEADILTILELEANASELPRPGKIDSAARALIEKVRRGSWQIAMIPAGEDTAPVAVTFDGCGRYRYERVLPNGLHETVVCDGKQLLHLYPEIGVGASRPLSRHYRAEFARLVPWVLPSAEDLAWGADLKLLDANRIAIVPHVDHTIQKASGQVHLIFADKGTLAERCQVAASGAIVRRELYAPDGWVRLVDGTGREVAATRFELQTAHAPNLTPEVSKLVILPLPYRTFDYWGLLRVDERRLSDLDDNTRLALLSSYVIEQQGARSPVLNARLQQGKLPGHLTLQAALGMPLSTPIQGNGPLQQYLSGQKVTDGPDGFIKRLSTFRDLYKRWKEGNIHPEQKETYEKEKRELIDFLQTCHDSLMSWRLLELLLQPDYRAVKGPALAATQRVFKDHPSLGYVASYELARHLLEEGNSEEGKKAFFELYSDTLREGYLPPTDHAFERALREGLSDHPEWDNLLREVTPILVGQGRRQDVVRLAWQWWRFGAQDRANELFAAAFAGVSREERLAVSVCALDFLSSTKQQTRADALLQALLADKEFAQQPLLWRLAASYAWQWSRTARAVSYLERALDLEYQKLPESVLIQDIQTDYGELFAGYQKLATATATLERAPAPELVAGIIRTADRWWSLTGSSEACVAAADVLATLGLAEQAWDYATTPLAQDTDTDLTAANWSRLAQQLVGSGKTTLADRAFAEACRRAPTNAQYLFDRAQNLHQSGRTEEARHLFQQVVSGTWDEQFAGLKERARRLAR